MGPNLHSIYWETECFIPTKSAPRAADNCQQIVGQHLSPNNYNYPVDNQSAQRMWMWMRMPQLKALPILQSIELYRKIDTFVETLK